MCMTGLNSFDQSLNKTRDWLKDVQQELNLEDPNDAYSAVRAVLHSLRDRLTVEEASDFSAQLPMLLVGVYYDGWNPAGTPSKVKTRDEFLNRVDQELGGRLAPEEAVRSVLGMLEKRISSGEIDDVKGCLPDDLKSFWPQPGHQ